MLAQLQLLQCIPWQCTFRQPRENSDQDIKVKNQTKTQTNKKYQALYHEKPISDFSFRLYSKEFHTRHQSMLGVPSSFPPIFKSSQKTHSWYTIPNKCKSPKSLVLWLLTHAKMKPHFYLSYLAISHKVFYSTRVKGPIFLLSVHPQTCTNFITDEGE